MGLKALVQNRAYPEGSIAEGYIVSECLTFCSRYFSDVETIFSRPPRNDGYIQKWYIFSSRRRQIDTLNTKILDMRSLAQANRYVLLHSDKLSPYRQEFLESERAIYGGIQISKRTEDKWLVEKFPRWLAKQLIHTGNRDLDNSYILASQAKQVFYVKDGKSEGWLHVIRVTPRDLFNLGVETPVEDDEYPQCNNHIVVERRHLNLEELMWLGPKVGTKQRKMIGKRRTLKGVQFSSRGSSTGSNALGSVATDSQSTGDETPTQSVEGVPATLDETTKGTKRKRGPTNMKDIWNLQPGTRIVVDANQYGQPIGKEVSKLAEFLGTIARTGSICPLNTKHWKHLPKYVLENILAIVHEKFDLQEIYENNPPGVHDDQWKWLVERWGTPQAAAQSEKAKESRTKVRYAHTAGRTGYATLNAQFAKNEGREPSHLEQFRFQHLRKDGSDKLSSEAAQQVYDKACKMVKDSMPTPESSFTPQDNIELENEVYTQVFGPEKDGKM
ncbi:hypothetical protein PVK06_036211 [Gossypium arboreum]|uniref:DUF4218 domain-containing protein n=1 Tax=Gossypium arboreum TaxID=29729 RepID=A0ABR0NJY2_GOSAR|nr:hypothetical protein PVK06_036211 [Gossypium arboreum]